jgi:hypothetical protein
MVGNEIIFLEIEMVTEGKAVTLLTTSVKQHHPAQDSKRPFVPCVPKLGPV